MRHIQSCHPLTLSSLPAPIANVSYPLLSLYCNYLSTAGTVCPTSHSHQHAPTGQGRVCSILISDHDKIYCDCHPWCVGVCSDSDLPASAQNTCVKDMHKHTRLISCNRCTNHRSKCFLKKDRVHRTRAVVVLCVCLITCVSTDATLLYRCFAVIPGLQEVS